MEELLGDFLTESAEQLGEVESLLVRFERTPSDMSLITGIFRLVHTIKGTSSFIGLERLQSVAHAAETLLGRMRDGEPPTELGVSLVLNSIDHIRELLAEIERAGGEPPGDSGEIIAMIENYLDRPMAPSTLPTVEPRRQDQHAVDTNRFDSACQAVPAGPSAIVTSGGDRGEAARQEPREATKAGAGHASETIRVTVSTIESMMLLVSELVLARNQLLELARHKDDDALKLSLQRLSGLTSDLQDAVMRARMQPVSRLFANLPRTRA